MDLKITRLDGNEVRRLLWSVTFVSYLRWPEPGKPGLETNIRMRALDGIPVYDLHVF